MALLQRWYNTLKEEITLRRILFIGSGLGMLVTLAPAESKFDCVKSGRSFRHNCLCDKRVLKPIISQDPNSVFLW